MAFADLYRKAEVEKVLRPWEIQEAEREAERQKVKEDAQVLLQMKSPDKSWKVKRTQHCRRELSFALKWAKECKPVSWLNFGQGCVQDLFIDSPGFAGKVVAWLTKRERMIAATVVQWFGTNCGWCFLSEALKDCGHTVVKTNDYENLRDEVFALRKELAETKKLANIGYVEGYKAAQSEIRKALGI